MSHKGIGCRYETVFALFMGTFAVAVVVLLSADMIKNSGNVAVAVFSVDARGDTVLPGASDVGGRMHGELRINLNMKRIRWDMWYSTLGDIRSLRIDGPIGTTTAFTGPTVIALCGGDAVKTCNVVSPGRVKGELTEDSNGYLSPRPAIEEIALRPGFYYLTVTTTTFPDGALRMQLGYTSGPGAWYE